MTKDTSGFKPPRYWHPRIYAAIVLLSGLGVNWYFQLPTMLSVFWLVILFLLFFPQTKRFAIVGSFQLGVPAFVATTLYGSYLLLHLHYDGANSFIQLSYEHDKVALFFQITATLYAIVTAFTLWRAMADLDQLKATVRDEATKLTALLSFLDYFDNVEDEGSQKALKGIRMALRDYSVHVIARAWVGVGHANAERLKHCIDLVEDLKTPEENDKAALHGLINGLSDLSMIRSRRISLMQSKISPYLIILLTVLAAFSLFFFFLEDSTVLNLSHFIIPALAFLYSFLVVMLIDLDYPFSGYWRVDTSAFEEVLDRVNEDLGSQEHILATNSSR